MMIDAWIIENLNFVSNIKEERASLCFVTFLKLVSVDLWTHPEWEQRKWTKTEVNILERIFPKVNILERIFRRAPPQKKQEMETFEDGLAELALSDISSGANFDLYCNLSFYRLWVYYKFWHYWLQLTRQRFWKFKQNKRGRKDVCELGDNNSKSCQVSTTHIAKVDTPSI